MARDEQGERTEDPTPRRLEAARLRGEIPRSRDLVAGVGFMAVVAAMGIGGASWMMGLLAYTRAAIAAAPVETSLAAAGGRALASGARALLLPVGVAALAALAVGYTQTGGLIASKALRFDPSRVLPQRRRVFSAAAAAQVGTGLLKLTVLGAVAWGAAYPHVGAIVALCGASPWQALSALAAVMRAVALRVGIAGLVIGVLDYLWQRRRHWAGLRMTRDEVRRDHKENEGDPQHRAERRRLHGELATQRMIADVREADFVVVNPDHIAVAIRYDRDGRAAPTVVAKGERLVAEMIKGVAREAGVPIFRDVTLARSLRSVEEGDEIPEALYEAVAEILRVVYGERPPNEVPLSAPPAAGPATPSPGWRRA